MVGFGSQIQGVQGDEPGEAVMLDDSGAVPGGGGGMKWTRIPVSTTLEVNKAYKAIGPLGSIEFVFNPDYIGNAYLMPNTDANTSRRLFINTDGTTKSWGYQVNGWKNLTADESNTRLYVLEE